ncbi:MAG: hypothetical protein CBC96_00605 [Pelagibacteraceae bacterium TMED136]|nr:MAG: hypothetical protein CBC96_00605 [Pelagibacteraceae bacterium TMED136]
MQFTILFLLFVPIIEIYFMIKIGTIIGAFNTIMATLITAAVGLYFVRLQGISTLYSAANNLRNNREPFREILNGFCLIISAVLLIIPGFVTDIIGTLLLIPFSRNIILKFIKTNNHINKKRNQNDPDIIEIQAEEIDERNKK